MNALPLDAFHIGLAASLVVVLAALSLVLQLRLARPLLVASLRTVSQLALVGLILDEVFALDTPWAVGAVGLAMVAMAGRAAVQRSPRTYRGASVSGTLTLGTVAFATAIFGTAGILGAEPWWRPQYVIPLLGVLLGNSLTGVSLCLDTLLEALTDRRAQVEVDLAHGATRWEALREPVARAVRRGMVPILNSMSVVGIVSLPGMMTGQILAGAEPWGAVKYQILIMFLIAFATALGALTTALVAFFRLTNRDHQLLHTHVIVRPD